MEREWVGLRPGRDSVRLEAQQLPVGLPPTSAPDAGSTSRADSSGRDNRRKHQWVVHNYGHGGGGISLSWGCAGHAVRLVKQLLPQLQDQSVPAVSSKL